MVLKNLPYLDNSLIQRRYDAIEVADIMSEGNVQLVAPRETARSLVEILERSTHNGFPVVDPETKKFLGLVRRDQIAALLECGVFDKTYMVGDGDNATPAWARPQSGVDKSPLMRTFLLALSCFLFEFIPTFCFLDHQAGHTTSMMIDTNIFSKRRFPSQRLPQGPSRELLVTA